MTTSDVSKKIRKLLALAESPNEHEAALALAKANELLTKYNLTLDDTLAVEGDQVVIKRHIRVQSKHKWRKYLADSIAKYNYCKVVTTTNYVWVIGRPDNVDTVEEIWRWSMLKIEQLYNRAWYNDRKPDEGGNAWRNSYMLGLTWRLGQRMQEARREQMTHPAVTTMVRVRDAELDGFVKQTFPNVSEDTYQPLIANFAAYRLGKRDGTQVGFGQKELE